MIGGVLVPILVGLVTKLRASPAFKSVANAVLSAVAGAVGAASAAGDWSWETFGLAWGSAWAVSIASHYGLWKPTGATSAVQGATADVGIGPARPDA
jgi:hypothetical protein